MGRKGYGIDVKLRANVATEDAFLFAYVSNISEMGIFLASDDPKPVGTLLKLNFKPIEVGESFEVEGEVVWVNPVREKKDESLNPGMGVKFVNIDDDRREKIIDHFDRCHLSRGEQCTQFRDTEAIELHYSSPRSITLGTRKKSPARSGA